MNRVGSYMHCIAAGFFLWTLGNGLTLLFNRDTSLAVLIIVLIVEGAGIGLTLQPTLVGMYANGRNEDRAVTTGLRNFIRTIGGAFGLVISGVILSNTLSRDLSQRRFVSESLMSQLTSSTYDLDQFGLTQEQQEVIFQVYMLGLHYIFIFFTACSGLSLCLTFWVGNTSLKAPKKLDEEEAVSTSKDEDLHGRQSIHGQDVEIEAETPDEKDASISGHEKCKSSSL